MTFPSVPDLLTVYSATLNCIPAVLFVQLGNLRPWGLSSHPHGHLERANFLKA